MYVDEYNTFADSTDISVLLAEARKYGARFCLLVQTCAYFSPEVLRMVLGNVSTYISFCVGSWDAELLAKEFGRNSDGFSFEPVQLVDLSDYTFILKTVRNHTRTTPKLYRNYAPLKFNPSELQKVIRTSNANHGKARTVLLPPGE